MSHKHLLIITDENTDIAIYHKDSDDKYQLERDAVTWMREEYGSLFTADQKSRFSLPVFMDNYEYISWLTRNVSGIPGITLQDTEETSWIINPQHNLSWSIALDIRGDIWQFRLKRPVPGWEGYVPTIIRLKDGKRLTGMRCDHDEAIEWCREQLQQELSHN